MRVATWDVRTLDRVGAMNVLVEEMGNDQTTSLGIMDIDKCKIKNWKERSKNKADWNKSINEAKVRIGL